MKLLKGGLLVTFEGGDHSGKTGQIAALSNYLRGNHSYPLLTTRQPGGSGSLPWIREALLLHDMGAITELLLFAADQAEHVSGIIQPALNSGIIVISDRFYDSAVSYQGYGRGHDLNTIDTLNAISTAGLCPDLTILLDIDPEVASTRVAASDKFEKAGPEFKHRVRQGYLRQAQRFPDRIKVLDATEPFEVVTMKIIEQVEIAIAAKEA